MKLLALYRRDDASIAEFASLIAADPAMAAKVMAAANSAAYRTSETVRDLNRCLNVLGTETVRSIVISQAIYQSMHSVAALRRADLGPYWRHSLLAAAVARELARHSAGVQQDEAYLAGLLHDIGHLALLAAAPEFHAEGLGPDDDFARCAVERRWMMVDHAEAGAWLIGRWRLSRALADSVRYHHEPLPRLVNADPLIRIVALAHLVAEQSPDAAQVSAAATLCGMDLAQVTRATEQAHAKLRGAAEHLGISLDAMGVPVRSSAAAEQVEREVEPLLVATTLLADESIELDQAERLQHVAQTAQMVFQFSEVVPLVVDSGQMLRRAVLAGHFGADTSPLPVMPEIALPLAASDRLRDALATRRPLFIDRQLDAAADLSIAEDQLLRQFSTDQLVCLPLYLTADRSDSGSSAVLVGVGDSALMADLAARQGLLSAFASRADTLNRRAAQRRAKTDRLLDRRAAQQRDAARDLVHEINNPLTIMQNYLDVLGVKLGTSKALSAHEQRALGGDIGLLQQEVARVGRLVQALSAEQPATGVVGAVDVDHLIADVVQLFRTQAEAAGIAISSRFNSAPIKPAVQRDQLEQVLLNLVKNAVEALAPAQPGATASDGAQIVVSNNGLVNRDGRLSLAINVRDNGPGMPAELLAQLFSGHRVDADLSEPGEETPDVPQHRLPRGRGLTIVHGLVQSMGAGIQCRSNLTGTSFDILLPYRTPASPELALDDR